MMNFTLKTCIILPRLYICKWGILAVKRALYLEYCLGQLSHEILKNILLQTDDIFLVRLCDHKYTIIIMVTAKGIHIFDKQNICEHLFLLCYFYEWTNIYFIFQ